MRKKCEVRKEKTMLTCDVPKRQADSQDRRQTRKQTSGNAGGAKATKKIAIKRGQRERATDRSTTKKSNANTADLATAENDFSDQHVFEGNLSPTGDSGHDCGGRKTLAQPGDLLSPDSIVADCGLECGWHGPRGCGLDLRSGFAGAPHNNRVGATQCKHHVVTEGARESKCSITHVNTARRTGSAACCNTATDDCGSDECRRRTPHVGFCVSFCSAKERIKSLKVDRRQAVLAMALALAGNFDEDAFWAPPRFVYVSVDLPVEYYSVSTTT